MDFSGFDATLIATVDLNQHQGDIVKQDEDDVEQEKSADSLIIDENPCSVCGHKAYANYIDLSQSGSCTGQSAVPIRRKLKEILRRVWENKRDNNNVLCLACYDLVDRFDSLEAQLSNIRENIEEKYERTCKKRKSSANNNRALASGAIPKRRGPRVKRTARRAKGDNSVSIADLKQLETIHNAAIDGGSESSDVEDPGMGGGDSSHLLDVSDGGGRELGMGGDVRGIADGAETKDIIGPDGTRITTILQPAPFPEVENTPNPNVYDEHHSLLQRGEKIRLGKTIKDANGCAESYICAYCPQLWPDISLLHSHVHTFHMPEVVDVAIPAELGLGPTMNCGVEIQNCSEPVGVPKPWSCLFCDASFRARTNLSAHFKEKHTPYKPFACVDCGDAFRKGIDLNRHKLYFCPQRTVVFAPKRKYRKRDKTASNKKKIKSESSD